MENERDSVSQRKMDWMWEVGNLPRVDIYMFLPAAEFYNFLHC